MEYISEIYLNEIYLDEMSVRRVNKLLFNSVMTKKATLKNISKRKTELATRIKNMNNCKGLELSPRRNRCLRTRAKRIFYYKKILPALKKYTEIDLKRAQEIVKKKKYGRDRGDTKKLRKELVKLSSHIKRLRADYEKI